MIILNRYTTFVKNNCYRGDILCQPSTSYLSNRKYRKNAGNIARTCAATGARLHIIKPMGFTVDDKKLKRAGLDYWYLLDITYYENLDDFFFEKRGQLLFLYHQGQNHIFGRQLSGRLLSLLRQRKQPVCPKSCC